MINNVVCTDFIYVHMQCFFYFFFDCNKKMKNKIKWNILLKWTEMN